MSKSLLCWVEQIKLQHLHHIFFNGDSVMSAFNIEQTYDITIDKQRFKLITKSCYCMKVMSVDWFYAELFFAGNLFFNTQLFSLKLYLNVRPGLELL